jgi:tetratricopeptide (TPR) repeat protein
MRRRLLAVSCVLALLPCWLLCVAQQPDAQAPPLRIFEQDPYDLLVLKPEARGREGVPEGTATELKILPLPQRSLPENPRPNEKLIVKLVDDPATEYEVLWRDIQEVRLFEQLVLAEANALVQQRQFDAAYDYFQFLLRYHAGMPGLREGFGEYLYQDAGHWMQRGKYENALALLNELYARYPDWPALPGALGTAVDHLVQMYEGRGDHTSAVKLVDALAARFPTQETVRKWESAWSGEASRLMESARAHMAAGEFRLAHEEGTRAMGVWPRLAGLQELVEEIYRAYPQVYVGVTSVAGGEVVGRPLDWAGRRQSRLLHRTLFEYLGPGPEGGEYECPLGYAERLKLGRRLVIRLKERVPWSNGARNLTGFDVARRLIEIAGAGSVEGSPGWSQLLDAVEVRDAFEVQIDLRWAHPRPEALLQVSVEMVSPVPGSAPESQRPTIGPYHVLERSDGQVRFGANTHYFAVGPTQPREVVEIYFADGAQAAAALRQGRVSVLDRVSPWEVETLQADPNLVVEPYGVPTMHMLLANPQSRFTYHWALRRAILKGINRELILSRHLLKGRTLPGCQVVSGPFPIGLGQDDPRSYAYNRRIAPQPYDPRTAMTLVSVALKGIRAAFKARGEAEPEKLPELVLAHPPHDLARTACQAIQKHLDVIGVKLVLREMLPGEWRPADGAYDLVYAEFPVEEPLIEARRILGPGGAAGVCSSYMGHELARLDGAVGWRQASTVLARIHELCDQETAVIPLWQLFDHFAYHRSVQGLGRHPALLYQNIESWQCSLRRPGGSS